MNHLIKHLCIYPSLNVFGANFKDELDGFIKALAEEIAKSKKVCYISFIDYKERLESQFLSQSNLSICTSLNYYSENFFSDLIEVIETTEANIIVVDDLDALLGENENASLTKKDNLIKGLFQLSRSQNISIVLPVQVSRNSIERGGDKRPQLRDFNWTRALTHLADNIFSIYPFNTFDIVEDEYGTSTIDKIEILSLKNKQLQPFRTLVDEVIYN